MQYITQHEIQSVYSMDDCIGDLKEGFRLYLENKTHAPVRTVLHHSHSEANTLFMPSYIEGLEYETVKVVSIFPNNPEAGIRTLQSVILLTETENGHHLATIEASGLTVMRTGAGAGVATEYLAKKNARKLSILGCGAQSRGQLQAVLAVRPIERVFLWNRTKEKAFTFKEEIQQSGWQGEVIVCETANKAASEADVLCLSSKSQEALFDVDALQPGAHINAIGSYRPDLKEFGADTLEQLDQLWVDTLEGTQHEAGELIQAANQGAWSWDKVNGELAELVTGDKPGRLNDKEMTLYKSVGVAYMDTITAARVYEKVTKNPANKHK
ncbi:ornithine cyclodeaminase family protein [Halobacillus shinanisalinarum]|uniref:Ornithine cyclodeaminase family protein n=1 Tax=Halobacillus shinanisalinarum TaxID=2932258 RepID=A0ABY4GVZ7_9BACI|nr:ornithine cyclodeaminase family protein [Halobacillus shinanisalinarum]UOQ92323.1 ornithine cyclodeaminase family protein [Halobacillus shinanisalinarum]